MLILYSRTESVSEGGFARGTLLMHQRKNCYKVTVLTLDPMASTVLVLNILHFKTKYLLIIW